MAPTASHEPGSWLADTTLYIRSLLSYTTRDDHRQMVKRADSGSLPSGQIAGFAAAIAILSAIILVYSGYRFVKYYLARRNGQRTYPARYNKKGDRIGEIAIPDSTFSHIGPLATGRSNEHLVISPSSQFHAPMSSAGLYSAPSTPSNNGGKTPRLDWKTPTLTPWSKSFSNKGMTTRGLEHDAELGRAAQQESTGNEMVSFPAQAYSEQGKFKEKFAMVKFGFRFGKSKAEKEDEEAYVMVNTGSPPVGSPPPQYANNQDVTPAIHRCSSPPLPPLPSGTPVPFVPLDTVVAAVTPTVANNADVIPEETEEDEDTETVEASRAVETTTTTTAGPTTVTRAHSSTHSHSHSHSYSSRPVSRVPTVKGSRLTSTTIASHSGRISTVILGPTPNPSPRVSSLYHSRHSSHSYTPASPGLPNPLPPLPPMPPLPAYLLGRTNSFKSVHTKKDSLGSVTGGQQQQEQENGNGSIPQPPSSNISPTDLTKGPDGKPLPRTMVVTATFTPSLSDELPLTIGETVSMLEEYIDGWCFVQRVKILIKPTVTPTSPNGISVSVHGTVDVGNTITVPVEGEGNSGAVPRFCVSEWPLVPTTITHMQEAAATVVPSVEDNTNLPNGVRPSSPPSFLPSVHIDAETAAKIAAPLNAIPTTVQVQPVTQPPSSFQPVSVPVEQSFDSKFSSWGSIATGAPATGIMSILNTKDTNQPLSLQTNIPSHSTQPSAAATAAAITAFKSSLLNPNPSGRIAQQPQPAPSSNPAPLNNRKTMSLIADNANESRVTSTISDASFPAPAPPPASPASQPSPEEGSEDSVKRVSKPPPAPRLSRFPSPEREVVDLSSTTFPTLPKASERTMTMPPLSRGISLADTLTVQPQPPFSSSNTTTTNTNNNNNNVVSSSNLTPPTFAVAKPGFGGPWSSDGGLARMDSTGSTAVGSSGTGTSAGSKTPSTAQTMSSDGSATSKRFTSAVQLMGGNNAINNNNNLAVGGGRNTNVMGARPMMGTGSGPSGPRAKPGGPGVVSFKALRTGSATASVTSGTLQR